MVIEERHHEVLDAVGDSESVHILTLTERPQTVAELAEKLGLSQSSAYRKVGLLEDVGLLEPTNPDATGTIPTRYRRTTGELRVRF